MKTVREGPLVTLPRTDGKTVDVFTGKGWDRHTVFEVFEGRIRLISGPSLTMEEFKAFKSRV